MTEPPLGWSTVTNVVRVIDGDTVEVEIKRRFTIRLLGLMTPEVRGAGKAAGLRAKRRLAELLEGAGQVRIFVPTDGADNLSDVLTFGRPLGWLFVDGKDVAELMVTEGHGELPKKKRKGFFFPTIPPP